MRRFIKLLTQHGEYPKGSIHEVVRVVPHGGHSDSEKQYVLDDGSHVISDHAEEVDGPTK